MFLGNNENMRLCLFMLLNLKQNKDDQLININVANSMISQDRSGTLLGIVLDGKLETNVGHHKLTIFAESRRIRNMSNFKYLK